MHRKRQRAHRNNSRRGRAPILDLLASRYFWAVLVFAISSAIYFGRLTDRVDHLQEGLNRIAETVDHLRDGVNAHGGRLGTLEHRIGATETRLEGVGRTAPPQGQANTPLTP